MPSCRSAQVLLWALPKIDVLEQERILAGESKQASTTQWLSLSLSDAARATKRRAKAKRARATKRSSENPQSNSAPSDTIMKHIAHIHKNRMWCEIEAEAGCHWNADLPHSATPTTALAKVLTVTVTQWNSCTNIIKRVKVKKGYCAIITTTIQNGVCLSAPASVHQGEVRADILSATAAAAAANLPLLPGSAHPIAYLHGDRPYGG